MPERDEFDLLIDSALQDYAEPRAGLENRILAQIAGRSVLPSRRRWILAAIAAVPTVAFLLVLSYLIPWSRWEHPSQMAYTPAVPAVAPVITPPASHPALKEHAPHYVLSRDRVSDQAQSSNLPRPKLDVFPAPQPLNSEEQALSRFATEAPEADRKALVEGKQLFDEPLNISALRIPPLPSPEDNQN